MADAFSMDSLQRQLAGMISRLNNGTPSPTTSQSSNAHGGVHSLRTSDISLVSHAHGRARRAERSIQSRELQAAVKYGRKERANPGRDGQVRWKYTHAGVVYVTDETSRHEITSWRIDGANEEDLFPLVDDGRNYSSHTVIIVDHSGSMRKADVPGYASRTEAVYHALLKDFVEPQLQKLGGMSGQDDAVVSLIEMSDDARIVLNRHPINKELCDQLKNRMRSYARSHGNYLPALDKVLEMFARDTARQLFLLFVSDGAPSDHNEKPCDHGVNVWQTDEDARYVFGPSGKKPLVQCAYEKVYRCRQSVKESIRVQCLEKLMRIGDLLGRDRVQVATVAFGSPNEEYKVLEEMATVLPRGSFQKLGLSSDSLKSAFSSLTSDLTSLRTAGGSSSPLTKRQLLKDVSNRSSTEIDTLSTDPYWSLYFTPKKQVYCLGSKTFVDVPMPLSTGVAMYSRYFDVGVERAVFKCFEFEYEDQVFSMMDLERFPVKRIGLRLVAKESLNEEYLTSKFHKGMCRVQAESQAMAQAFNRRMGGFPEWEIEFLPCEIYEVEDNLYPKGIAWILAEPELDGKFTKWNNNAGSVKSGGSRLTRKHDEDSFPLGVIREDSEDEDEDNEDDFKNHEDIPQTFSHFTHTFSQGKKLVCDLQGTWNSTDGFTFTDPAIHYNSSSGRNHRNGGTDKGYEGIKKFFKTHECNAFCRRLGLRMPDLC